MTQGSGRKITGRSVFWSLVAFFAVIFAMNIVMIWLALTSFSGIEAKNAYEAGRNYNESIAAAREQKTANWAVKADLDRSTNRLFITIADNAGAPISGLDVAVEFRQPTSAVGDQSVTLAEVENGRYRAALPDLADGQWDLVINAQRGDQLVYTSRNRMVLK